MKKKITTVLASLIIYSLMMTTFAFGQNVNKPKQSNSEKPESVKSTDSSKYLVNFTALAKNGQVTSAIGIEKELEKVVKVLSATTQKNPVVVDEFTGKSRMILGNLANRLLAEDAPANLRGKNVLSIEMAAILADAKNQTQAETILSNLLNEINFDKGSYILFIDDISVFGKENPAFGASVADKLRQALETGKVQIFSTSTTESFNYNIASDVQLKNRFQKIQFLDDADEDGFVGDKLSPDLRELVANGEGNKKVKVILQADDIKNPELLEILRQNNVVIESLAENLDMMVVELNVSAAEQIASISGTNHLSLDKKLSSLGHIEMTTGVLAMRSQTGNSGLTGKGVGIAIVDSAIYDRHKSFVSAVDGKKRITDSKEFTHGGGTDKFGHGTHVAAIAAGGKGKYDDLEAGNALNNYQGIAPEASLIPVRVLENNGVGSTAAFIEAMNWIYEKRIDENIKVVNLSLGTPAIETWRNDPVCRAVRRLTAAGVVVVAAAGNNGKSATGQKLYGAIHAPGNDPTVITVGASNTMGTDQRSDDIMATYSSHGPTRSFYTDSANVKQYDNLVKPDLVAPGNKVIAAAAKENALLTSNPTLLANTVEKEENRLMYLSGTSMATPVVSGTVALMLQANPKLTPNMVKMILMYTAQPLAGFNHLEQGAGQLECRRGGQISQTRPAGFNRQYAARHATADNQANCRFKIP